MEFDTEKIKKPSKSFKFLRRTSKVVSSFFKISEESSTNSTKTAPIRSQSFKYRGEGRKPIRERRKSAGSFRHDKKNHLKPIDSSTPKTTQKPAMYRYLPLPIEQIKSETPNRRKSALSTIIGRKTPYNRSDTVDRYSGDQLHNRNGHTDDPRHSNEPTKELIKRSKKSLIFTSLQPHPSNNKKVVVAVSRAPRGRGQQQIHSFVNTNSKHRLVRIKSKSGDVQKPLKIVDNILERRSSLQYDLSKFGPTRFINKLQNTKRPEHDKICFKNSLSSSNYSGSSLSDTSPTLTCESDNEHTIQGGQLGTITSLADHLNSQKLVKTEIHASQNTGNQQFIEIQPENIDIMQPIKKQLLDQKRDKNSDQKRDLKRDQKRDPKISDGSIKQRVKKLQLMRHASHHGHHTVLNNSVPKLGLQRVIANHDIAPDDFITNSVQASPREHFQVATRSVSLSNKFNPRKSTKINRKEYSDKYQSITSLNSMDSSFYKPTVGSYTSLASRDSFFENTRVSRKYLTKEQVKSANFQDFQEGQTAQKVQNRAKSTTQSVEKLNKVSSGWENNVLSKTVSESSEKSNARVS